MMREYAGYGPMVNYGWGSLDLIQIFFTLFVIILFVDTMLLGVWLWKQINKK